MKALRVTLILAISMAALGAVIGAWVVAPAHPGLIRQEAGDPLGASVWAAGIFALCVGLVGLGVWVLPRIEGASRTIPSSAQEADPKLSTSMENTHV